MQKISVLKVDSPSCFWGREDEYMEKYKQLHLQMNLFYHDLALDLDTVTPSSLEEGQVCVVYWAKENLWCRAVVEFLIKEQDSVRAACFLVDYGEKLIISSHRIRVAVHQFLELPFWVKKFRLAGIAPRTLKVTVHEEKAKLVPSRWWDSSATLYLHNLLQASTETEAAFVELESDCTSVQLYLTIDNNKMCVNDDLVNKKYAYYNAGSTDFVGFPFTQTSTTSSNRLVTRIPAPSGEHAKSKSLTASGDNGLLAPPVCSQHEEDTGSKVTEEWFPTRLRGWDDAAPAGTQRDSSEDFSKSAALDRKTSQFSFLQFLHSDSSPQEEDPTVCQTKDPQPEETAASDVCAHQEIVDCGVEGLEVRQIDSTLIETFSSPPEELGSEEKTCRSEPDLICSELLEWLNPGPLNPDPDANVSGDLLFSMDVKKSGILVHSALQVETCSSLEDAPVTDVIRWVLEKKQYTTLSPTDRYSWPSVARGNNTLIITHNAGRPLGYLYPLLTHILLASLYTCSSGPGPIAVLLCVGWKKVHKVFEVLQESKVGPLLHPAVVLVGLAVEEAKAFKIPKNCLLVVTTPFSLVRLLSHHCFLFMRVCHLVLDEADQLFALAPDQTEHILEHFKKLASNEALDSCIHQLVAVAKTWTGPMRNLLAGHMPNPCIVIGVPEEAALYGDVQQFVHMCQDISKLSLLLALLEANPKSGQKTVIVTNSLQELEDVFKALKSRSLYCLKTHEDFPDQFDSAMQQWRTDVGSGTHLILVTTDRCLTSLNITDAVCVLHYGFPASPRLFGRRILCMAQQFPNLSQVHKESKAHVTRSVLLITEKNGRHVNGLLRYLVRSGASMPPELLAFAEDAQAAQEGKKEWRPLCSYLKSFGVCRDSMMCPDRHRFVPRLDQSQLAVSGTIQVVPLYIKTASVFLGRIVSTSEEFQRLSSEMACYYAERKPGASQLQEGGLYAVQEDKLFHRVKILCAQEPDNCLFFRVLVRFVDVGKEMEVRSHQILQLPECFHSLPAQAVEMVVCRVKPIDAETDWCPKVTRQISQKIRGLQHQARVVFSLGNTIFVDPMIRLTRVPGLKTCINEYNVQSEILNSRMGESNPNHIDLLRALCESGSSVSGLKADHRAELLKEEEKGKVSAEALILSEAAQSDGCLIQPLLNPELSPDLPSLERITLLKTPESSQQPPAPFQTPEVPPRIPAPEHIPQLPNAEPLLPWSKTPSVLPAPELLPVVPVCGVKARCPGLSQEQEEVTKIPHRKSVEITESKRDRSADCPSSWLTVCVTPRHNGVPEAVDEIRSLDINCNNSMKSYHPQVRWYQMSGSVVVTVKLINPENQSCYFHPDRVVYSGSLSGRSYKAELQLLRPIKPEGCSWKMKSNEPVLTLIKEQQEPWERLLINKNIFVSYDLEHIEEEEDGSGNGSFFLENVADNFQHSFSSDSDSD